MNVHKKKILKCSKCEKNFLEADDLKMHKENTHHVDINEKNYPCDLCNES